jgi:hypothetical protein
MDKLRPCASAPTPITREVAPLERPAPSRPFSLNAAPPATPPSAPAGPLSGPTKLLTRMLEDEHKVDVGLRAAMSGQKLDAQQLLVLQAQVIQYSQELEVVSRLVDKGAAAIKQTMQTQV